MNSEDSDRFADNTDRTLAGSEQPSRFALPADGLSADEREEIAIRGLLDQALQKRTPPTPPDPVRIGPEDSLDTTVRTDWTEVTEARLEADCPKPEAPAERPRKMVPARTQRIGSIPPGRTRAHLSRRVRWGLFAAVFALTAGAIGFRAYQVWRLHGGSPQALLEKASRLHAEGEYLQALEIYRALQPRTDLGSGMTPAQLAFSVAGAYEQLWRQGSPGSDIDFQLAVESLEQAVELDRSDLQVYAVDALLAKSDLLIAKARKTGGGDRQLEQLAWECLAGLIQNPHYSDNPAVRRGIPQRILAMGTEHEDPHTAIELLLDARKAQGDLERGIESFQIALIYRDSLDRPEDAEVYFDAAAENELASEEIRTEAARALEELRATHLLQGRALLGQPVAEYVSGLGPADWSDQP